MKARLSIVQASFLGKCMRNKLTELTEGHQNQLPKNLYRKQVLKSPLLFRADFLTMLTVTTSLLTLVCNWKILTKNTWSIKN